MRAAPARRLLVRTSTVAALLGVAMVFPAAVTSAAPGAPAADPSALAAQLQKQVAALQVQAEVASEKYDAAEAALGTLVVQQRVAQLKVAAAQQVDDAQQRIVGERAHALYVSGGTVAMYASMLDGASLNQVLSGIHDVQALSDVDRRQLAAAAKATSDVQGAQRDVTALIAKQESLTAAAADAEDAVEASLASQQQALDQANAQVQALAAQLQARIDAEQQAAAAQALASAAQAALASGYLPAPTSATAATAIGAAETQLGKPYVYGGSGPDSWDCSGLTQWAYRQAGIDLPRTAADQWNAGPKVALGELQPGDLLFWATDTTDPSTIHHVAIYLGGGMMLAAPHTGTVVQVQPVYLDGYIGAVRPA